MTKTIQIFATIILIIFAFFAGVSYSDAIKSHASWLFEQKEDEIELPDLSEEPAEVETQMPENNEMGTEQPVEETAAPAAGNNQMQQQ